MKTERILKVVKNDFKSNRVLPPDEPMPLNPPKFDDELIDFRNPGVKWFTSILKIDRSG